MATLPSIDQEREIVERVLASLARPEHVKAPLVEFREDHSGDESVYITFPIKVGKGTPLTPKRSKILFHYLQQVRDSLYEAQVRRIYYVRVSETR